jgi:hypothetical protein
MTGKAPFNLRGQFAGPEQDRGIFISGKFHIDSAPEFSGLTRFLILPM